MADKSEIKANLARVRARLADLDSERHVLQRELKAFEIRLTSEKVPAAKQLSFENAPVTNTSSSREKVELFRCLFAGRPDVFPLRWENKKTGRSGYSPACANEWVKGICEKPRVRCGACPIGNVFRVLSQIRKWILSVDEFTEVFDEYVGKGLIQSKDAGMILQTLFYFSAGESHEFHGARI